GLVLREVGSTVNYYATSVPALYNPDGRGPARECRTTTDRPRGAGPLSIRATHSWLVRDLIIKQLLP
ncbi:MAG: hypothetical protein JWP57_4516, partial [Spirosoma sp.]|nr:hypothetical protein [Spirosoma sp.]